MCVSVDCVSGRIYDCNDDYAKGHPIYTIHIHRCIIVFHRLQHKWGAQTNI